MSHLSFEPSEPSRERGEARSADDHISSQRLAALADEHPTTDERAHVSTCADCARELDAHRSLLVIAGSERETLGLPLTRWEQLSVQLRAEGLIAPGASDREVAPSRSRPHWMLRIAAALLLVAGGAMLGRFSAGATPLPGDERSDVASRTVRGDSFPTTFASVEDATRWKALYRDGYQRALSFLAQNDSVGQPNETPALMRTRLSTLDRLQRITREALNAAPNDPVINDFYLNAFGQREATLRELNTVLPQNVRMNSF
jgi:hypothetical protein